MSWATTAVAAHVSASAKSIDFRMALSSQQTFVRRRFQSFVGFTNCSMI
jgi:hypothetical protein